ncbi:MULTISPECIES: hypothetical protein [Micromonospora]|nr:hypothetical protein [Micromonospora sp. WMMC264]WBB88143.1 hypothetical protein O7542_13615 [Micromonospora sp. WMMC264]
MTALYGAIAASHRKTAVIKDALRHWHSDQAGDRDARGQEW